VSQHCQHRSTARTCAIFAYLLLACSECNKLFNHDTSQNNYGTCLSATGDSADFFIPLLPILTCYNSTASKWYQTLSEWHYYISARHPRHLWFWWYAFHSDPSSDGSPTWMNVSPSVRATYEVCTRKITNICNPRAVHRVGIASNLEPPIRRLPGLAAVAGASADGSAICPRARGDILLALPQGISIADISVVHPLSLNIISRASTTAGAAASHRDQQKITAYA
jgi:hypothetical protein